MQNLTAEQVRALAERHGLPPLDWPKPAAVGAANTVYFLSNEVVLRVAHSPEGAAAAERERRLLPLATRAGVRTPALVGFGQVPGAPGRPYLLLARVPGENLGTLGLAPGQIPEVYRELGRDLARWHLRPAAPDDPLADLPRDPHDDPRPGLASLVERGLLSAEASAWLGLWLDRLAPLAARPAVWRVVHGDARPSNVLVSGSPTSYRALLDWGDAGWADPASEFALMPLRAVPFALEGYRAVRPETQDEVSEARVLWYHLAWAVHALARAPARELTWSAPPAGRLLELLRFYAERPGAAWQALVP